MLMRLHLLLLLPLLSTLIMFVLLILLMPTILIYAVHPTRIIGTNPLTNSSCPSLDFSFLQWDWSVKQYAPSVKQPVHWFQLLILQVDLSVHHRLRPGPTLTCPRRRIQANCKPWDPIGAKCHVATRT